ncbi:polysaccharide deacetylase family protein [Planktotalea sp.]|uniref:polysaccharide deacetylase family protein n=1 Tax=Planktotalea sp. TaxID=2029877 RepID=UPI0035C85AC7
MLVWRSSLCQRAAIVAVNRIAQRVVVRVLQHAHSRPLESKAMLSRVLAIWLTLCALPLQAQQIAITIDDLPFVLRSRTTPQEGLKIVHDINAAMNPYNIVATSFAIGRHIDKETKPVMDVFTGAGHKVGNHSWSHPDYDTLTRWAFRREVRRTNRALRAWMQGPKYYRFPFLREGKTEKSRRVADTVLRNQGYVNAPVTIDNDEWQFNLEYVDALEMENQSEPQRIAKAYLEHMKERTAHFQPRASREMGRDVSHVLLLHMNKINADHLSDLLAWYADTGWTFITLDEALRDPLFSAPETYTGSKGLSQIERVLGE